MTSTLADLQRRNLAQMETASAPEASPVDTDIRKSVSTEVLTDGRKDAGTEAREQVSTEGSAPARKSARKESRAEGSKPAGTDAPKSVSADGLMEVVEAALASREPLLGGVKATVDMSPDLSTRAKRYLADHRGQNTRQVLIALFDAFLTAKGY